MPIASSPRACGWACGRPRRARSTWDVGEDRLAKPPKGTTHVVLDTPAGLKGSRMKDVLRHADKVIVPLQPSVFDIFATRTFLDQLQQHRHPGMQVGIVGMRVDARTIAADKLRDFVDSLGLPVLGYLRDTQNYIHLAAHRRFAALERAIGHFATHLHRPGIGRLLELVGLAQADGHLGVDLFPHARHGEEQV